jgi:hypothetical protein
MCVCVGDLGGYVLTFRRCECSQAGGENRDGRIPPVPRTARAVLEEAARVPLESRQDGGISVPPHGSQHAPEIKPPRLTDGAVTQTPFLV